MSELTQSSVDEYEKALKELPEAAAVQLKTAITHLASGDIEQALGHLSNACERMEDAEKMREGLGNIMETNNA